MLLGGGGVSHRNQKGTDSDFGGWEKTGKGGEKFRGGDSFQRDETGEDGGLENSFS